MSLFRATVILLLGLASAFTCHSQIENDISNMKCINSSEGSQVTSDPFGIFRETLFRILKGVIALINQLHEAKQEQEQEAEPQQRHVLCEHVAGTVKSEQDATYMKKAEGGTYSPGSFSFLPVYYRNRLPNCYQFLC